jgi:hypothetical protein
MSERWPPLGPEAWFFGLLLLIGAAALAAEIVHRLSGAGG